ncbi:dipeptidyl-peptidase [Geothrix limicola]|uniref:Dipeptidyl-peptidase n=1 Tax=Geothrix limicola TaxID=2927978 RepID=A0ABQ5QBW0_9BACT|nr:S46 family peptidase [Geothrix limicola]GLH71615.1 dipeptidyl-peptidase [Geothrix limicola]
MRLTALTLLLALPALRADEGMWTFDNLPTQKIQAKYGWAPDQVWLDHVRLSAVRFPGGSGSFVSKDGLVLTNHHVGHHWTQAVSDAQHDYVKNGFVAIDREHEIKVPGLALYTLLEMENVTERIEQAVPKDADDQAAAKAKAAALAALVKEQGAKTGLDCQPVSLYQGGQVWIYRYKKHTDVRLVMSPEYGVAAFGKDWDNFSWPRHDLDFSLFRVYENGKPYTPAQHLTWGQKGVQYGDPIFTVGHPGRTSRLETLAQMEAKRDVTNPLVIRALDRGRAALHAYAAQGTEQSRRVSADIMGAENAYKVVVGETDGLRDREAMARVAAAEKELRAKVAADPKLKALAGDSWTKVEEAVEQQKTLARESFLMGSLRGEVLGTALSLQRHATEMQKPADQRGPQYRDEKGLTALKARLKGGEPSDAEQELLALQNVLTSAQQELPANHPLVQTLLGGKSPAAAAKSLLGGTRLLDPAARAALIDGDPKAILESADPALALVRQLSPRLEEIQKKQQALQAVISEHLTRIAKARFAVYGTSTYPDATFTLRLSYGAVETYPSAGTLAQPFTTFAGMYDRAAGWGPKAEDGSWEVPARWIERRDKLNLFTPYNFISTNDIIGGNSGSPVVDKRGELVGLAFDGNIESNAGRYYFDARVNRCLSVDARAIVEALGKVYDANHLVAELTGK